MSDQKFKSLGVLPLAPSVLENVFAPALVRHVSEPVCPDDETEMLPPCGSVVRLYALQDNTWWDLFTFLSRVILEALILFRHMSAGDGKVGKVPSWFLKDTGYDSMTAEEGEAVFDRALSQWHAELDKMIAAFTILDKDDGPADDEQRRIIEDGLLSFACYFESLWD